MLSKGKGTSDDETIMQPIIGLQVTKFLRTFFVAEKIVITFLCITCGELFVHIHKCNETNSPASIHSFNTIAVVCFNRDRSNRVDFIQLFDHGISLSIHFTMI